MRYAPSKLERFFILGSLCMATCAALPLHALAQEEEDDQEEALAPAAAPAVTPKAAPKAPASKATDKPATPVAKPDANVKSEPTAEERAKQWHDKTPTSIARRVFVGATLGLGAGAGPNSAYSADRLGASVFGQYLLVQPTVTPEPTAGPALRWVIEGQYATTTGVDVDADESLSTQFYSAGGGADYALGSSASGQDLTALPLGSTDRMRFQAVGLLSVTKTMRHSLETGGRPASKFGASVGVDLRYLHLLHDRIEGVFGVGARVVGYSWFAANVGIVGSF